MKYLAVILVVTFLSSCMQKHSKSEIEEAMRQYDRHILHMDADSIALVFTPDGDLGGIAKGRDSIRNFLRSFKDVQVLQTLSTTDQIEMYSDSALQKGKYTQRALISGRDTVNVSGSFVAHWQWMNSEGWRLKKMETFPDAKK